VHTTAHHPWLTADHGWLPASFLRVGEPVRRADGTTAVVVAVRAVPGAAAMWDLTVGDLHDFAVGDGAFVVHNCKNPVQAGEAGSYDELSARAAKGDNLEAHHMPQKDLGFTTEDEGGALVMDRAEHYRTRTWGSRGKVTAREDADLSFRQVLAKDFRNVRSIAGTRYNSGLRQLLGYYRENFPELMRK
jgi:hypothetical protein